jgi:hypothetical protein
VPTAATVVHRQRDRVPEHAVKRHSLEHPLQRQIADALRLEMAPPGKVSRDGVVWWSVDHASYTGTAPGARMGVALSRACRICSCCTVASPTRSRHRLASYRCRLCKRPTTGAARPPGVVLGL